VNRKFEYFSGVAYLIYKTVTFATAFKAA